MRGDTDSPQFIGESGAEGFSPADKGALPAAEGALPGAEGALPTAEGFNPEVDTLIEDMGVELVVDLSEAFKSSLSRALITAQPGDTSAQQIVDLAHALKPTATMLGFSQLSQCCQQIDGLRSSGDISPAIDRRIELLSKIEMTLVLIERLADYLKATSRVD
jgi:HPt (histidine-containing phosphotransfer) domain-containing protein